MNHRKRLRLQQHTRVWRYFGRMKMLPLSAPAGPLPPLRNVLHLKLRAALEAPVGKRSPKAPPGAFRTAWGWRRIGKYRPQPNKRGLKRRAAPLRF